MRKLKGSGNYLRNQVWKNLVEATFGLLLFLVVFGAFSLRFLLSFNLDIVGVIGLLLSLVPLGVFYFYLRKYRIYRGGWEGEKRVVKMLSSQFSDDFLLLNSLYLRGGGGDIDHVVLSPGGIFVLETKNWSGNIVSNGDNWQRAGKESFNASPSRQVKRNVATIRSIIDSNPKLSRLGIWVQGIVVFTNVHANLKINNPTALIVKLQQLPDQILANDGSKTFSPDQLQEIAKEILKQKR
jgi:hypothetical protein